MTEKREHKCPHGGREELTAQDYALVHDCGTTGWLCTRCREDRADERTRKIVEALAGLGNMVDDSLAFVAHAL